MKKKKSLYISILAVLLLIFSVYFCLVVKIKNNADMELLQKNVKVLQTHIPENLSNLAKDLHYKTKDISKGDQSSIDSLINSSSNIDPTRLHVVDANGILHQKDNQSQKVSIGTAATRTAATSGYAVSRVNGSSQLALIIPVSNESPYFWAMVYPANEFVSLLYSNLPLSSIQCFAIFDELGNVFASHSMGGANSDAFNKLAQGSVPFLSNMKNSITRHSLMARYTAYIPLSQPKNWFVGEYVNYSNDGIISAALNPIVILPLLLFIIIGVVLILKMTSNKETDNNGEFFHHTDILTGLKTLPGLDSALSTFSKEHGGLSGYSFLCLDIVRFSRFNTMYGFSTGNKLLKIVADVLKDTYYCSSRSGADLFTFLVPDTEKVIEQLETVLKERICSELGEEYMQMISFKFGIYPIKDTSKSTHEIYECALVALKSAKQQSGQKVVVYDDLLENYLNLKNNIEMNMVHALSSDEFLIYIQPQIDMDFENCNRGEALIRWDSKQIGFMPPDKFIPIFENNGFIIEIDFLMLEKALELLEQRKNDGLTLPIISVNQSRVTLSFPKYLEKLHNLIKQFTVPLENIELEITESALEDDPKSILVLIGEIKKLGFTISLDDFGAAYSSLNTLRTLPVDTLKIDKGFLEESNTSEKSKWIIRCIVRMAKGLDISVVCEGVETEQQIDFIRECGCDIAQGYYYSKPIPLDTFILEFLKK